MKKTIYYIGLCLALFAGSSCSKEYDNYPEPQETLTGSVTDAATGKPIQTDASENGGTRIRLDELSYSDNPTPYYFFSRQDGTFTNTKVFKGKYRISVEGPFVPLLQYDAAGKITVDNRQTLDVAETTKVDFKVEPFLNVEWVGEPVYNSTNKTITVQAKFTRGTANTEFHKNISDIYLFVNPMPYIGNPNKDDRYSTQINYSGTNGNNLIGQTITIVTKGPLSTSRDFYLRVGARIDYGLKYYNYTDVKKITLP
jgi:hypothetical protein